MGALVLQEKKELLEQLQREILPLQGLRSVAGKTPLTLGLEPMNAAFPQSVFPTGAVHEFISGGAESAAATSGFLTGLMAGLMQENGVALWISHRRIIFPPALQAFGVKPHHVIFIDLASEKKVLWAMEEALKCPGISAVISEITDLSFTDSRRLQLATEHSGVTGLILRHPGRKLSTNACVARWQIEPLPGVIEEEMPGVGFPQWKVDLLKIRNGKPGSWTIGWSGKGFHFKQPAITGWTETRQRKAG